MRLLALLAVLGMALPARAQDRDGDRVLDAVDLCPDAREGTDALFPADGCPDTDGDHDHIVDDYDTCPMQPETVNGFRDLDGCPDAPPSGTSSALASPGPDLTRVGCWTGASLLDVAASASGSARLVPRADAPTWLGTATLECYAGASFDGRRAIHCATPDGAVEATLAMRIDHEHAIGVLAVRSVHGLVHRAWTGTALPGFDASQLGAMTEAHQDEIQACYEHELRALPTLEGRVSVQITIETSGEIDRVHTTSDTMSPARPAVAACLVLLLDALVVRAPPPCSSVTQTLQFVFEPEPESPETE